MRPFSLSTTIVFAVLALAPLSARATLPARGPWIQDARASQVSIAWEATSAGGTQTIAYGLGAATNQSATGTLVSGSLYVATLSGLNPASKYSYVVTSGAASGSGTFVTAPVDGTQAFNFAVYGDNRTNATPHAAVVAGLVAAAPDFAINTGDLEDELTASDYKAFFGIEQAFLANTPMFPAEGNHDTTTKYKYGFDRIGPNGESWYSFHWGNAFFLCVGADGFSSYAAGSAQLTWVASQLAAASTDPTVDWIFAYHHYPVYSSDTTHGSTANMQSTLDALYRQYGVDVVFNGHSHTYERVEKNGIVYIVAGGGGAPLYTIGTPVAGSMVAKSAYSFVTVDVSGGTLTLKAFDTSGNTLDSRTVSKTVGPPQSPTPTPAGSPNPTSTPGGDPANGSATKGGFSCDVGGADHGHPETLLASGIAGLAAAAMFRRRARRSI